MRALISVSDKTGVVDFARELVSLGWEILSTSGGEYVIVDCCNDPQKLKAIQRRIQAQMNGLDVSAGKVRGRVHLLERFAGWVRKERSDGAA